MNVVYINSHDTREDMARFTTRARNLDRKMGEVGKSSLSMSMPSC